MTMECTRTEPLSSADFLSQLNRKVARLRIPLSGSIELTHGCNLRCVHCYLGSRAARHLTDQDELSTEQLVSILDEITDAGCLNLLLTGGEPLLRADFAAVYSHAKTRGLLVTVFTNATLVTDELAELFGDLPPHQIEISLYGATAETYERITGVPGSFKRCLAGIHRLVALGLNVKLKTVLMTLNRHEFFDIERMASDLGVGFRFDAAIFPRLDGDLAPVELRVPVAEAVEKELGDEDRLKAWQTYLERRGEPAPLDEGLYQCGAGVTHFHIDPYGTLLPCLMAAEPAYDLLSGSFSAGWRNAMPLIRKKRAGAGYPCNACENRELCSFCPAFFALENGTGDAPSDYLCAMGHVRSQTLANAETAAAPTRRRAR